MVAFYTNPDCTGSDDDSQLEQASLAVNQPNTARALMWISPFFDYETGQIILNALPAG